MNHGRSTCILVHADVNLNLIDGSTVWLQSVCACLLRLPNVRVIIIAREAITNRVIVDPIVALGAELQDTYGILGRSGGDKKVPAPAEVVEAIERLDDVYAPALIVVRGKGPLMVLSDHPRLRSKVWAYWLQRPDITSPANDRDTFLVAERFGKMLVQSAGTKAVLETCYGIDAQKILSVPPMIPAETLSIQPSYPRDRLRVVYSGKFDYDYKVEEYIDLGNYMALHGVDVDIHMVGGKFNARQGDRSFVTRMQDKLRNTPGLTWHGGLPRTDAMGIMASASFGLCVRNPKFDSSLEVSTKLIEFCALSVPPILNRTAIHEHLLGKDYPFYASDMNGIATALNIYDRNRPLYEETRGQLRERIRPFSLEVNAARLRNVLETTGILNAAPAVLQRAGKKKVVVAGHDFKFLNGVISWLQGHPDIELRMDKWATTRTHDLRESERHLDWADSVFCEWCAGAAAWYTSRLKPTQECIVRLHRFEAFTPVPKQVDFAKVKRLIVVSSYFKDICINEFGVEPGRIDILPQFVDWTEFNRPKHPWANFTLGLVGINGFYHKRFDRAVEALRILRETDSRWRLRIRSAMPWDIDWVWKRPEEVEAFRAAFAQIVDNADLRDNIIFDRPGPDMAEWFRHVGFILSTSETEGCHTSVAEGMASGAFPALLNWPGADSVYPPEFVTESVPDLARLISSLQDRHLDEDARTEIAERAKTFDINRTRRHLERLMLE